MYKVPIFNCFSEGPYMHVKHSLAYLEIHENFPINRYCFQYNTIYFNYRNLNKNVHTVLLTKRNVKKLYQYCLTIGVKNHKSLIAF